MIPGALVSVLCPRSTSRSWSSALALARAADQFGLEDGGGFLAGFGRSTSQAAAALALLQVVGEWRGVVVTAGGRPVPASWGAVQNLQRVLSCYAGSAGQSPAAYCVGSAALPYSDRPDRHQRPVSVPCRHILRVYPRPLSAGSPGSVGDQLLARSVHAGCDWCPLLTLCPDNRALTAG